MARMRITLVLLLAIAAGGGLAFGTYQLHAERAGEDRVAADQARSWSPPPISSSAPRSGRTISASSSGRRARCRPAPSRRPNEIIGRGLVMPVIQNEPILPMKLRRQGGRIGAAAGHPRRHARRVGARQRGHRCRRLRPARHARRRRSPPRARPTSQADMTTKVVLTNVQVLAAGTKIEQRHRAGQADAGERRDAARQRRKSPSG